MKKYFFLVFFVCCALGLRAEEKNLLKKPGHLFFKKGKKKKKKKKYWWKKNISIKKLLRLGKDLAPIFARKPQEHPPEWVGKISGKPLFSFVQIADLHLWKHNTKRMEIARDYIKKNLSPSFLLFTGDNLAGPNRRKQQKFLKGFLDHSLGMNYHIIRGDNDAVGYEKVFGSTNWAFVYGGVQFVGFGLDVDLDWVGIGSFWHLKWLEKMVARPYPTIVIVHQPIYPPNFFNAMEINRLLGRHKNVFLVLAGHLHYDFQARYKGVLQILCPSIERNPAKEFKEYLIYKNQVVIKTHGLSKGRYRFARKWQKAKFPRGYRPFGPAKQSHFNAPPPSPILHVGTLSELFQKIWEHRLKKIKKKWSGLFR